MRKFLHNFIHCALLGWFLEITFTAFHAFRRRDLKLSGTTSVWMFPIYGMAALLSPICRLLKNRSLLCRGLTYTVMIFTGELLTGLWLNRRELCPWNYERSRWHLAKVIRLDYTPLWFLTGLLFERLLRENDVSLRPNQPLRRHHTDQSVSVSPH